MRASTSWVQRPPLPRQAADQTQQGGRQTDPETAPHRDAGPARGQRAAVIKRLNPIIRGWSAYYRTVVSSEAFSALDRYMWKLTYKWAKFSHPNKPRHWIIDRYFGTFNKSRQDRWVFGDRDSGAYLASSPGQRSSDTRWSRAGRPRTTPPWPTTGPTGGAGAHPRRWQRPACGSCRRSTAAARSVGTCSCTPTTRHKAPHEWEHWLRATRKAIRKQRLTYRDGRHVGRDRQPSSHTRPLPPPSTPAAAPALLPAPGLQGLLEPDAGKRASPVLRGAGAAMRPAYPAKDAPFERKPRSTTPGTSTSVNG